MTKKCRSFVAALVLAACGAPEPLRLGIVLDGEGIAGAEMAASEINASGGIGGRTLALRVMSAGNGRAARPAIVAAESLWKDVSVMAVVGHSTSSGSLAASQIYNARRIVQIAPTSSAPPLSRAGPYTFRLVASDIHQARFLADAVTAGGARPRTAVFFVNDDYGHALERELRAQLADRAVSLVCDAPYSEEEPSVDALAIARAVASSHPDVLVWLGRGPELLRVLPAIRRAMPALRVLASDGIDNAAINSSMDTTLDGVQYVSFLDLHAAGTRLNELKARAHAKTGMGLSVETALSYDAVMLLATAARAVGPNRVAIRDYLASLGSRRVAYAGVTGPIAFDASGEPRPSYFLTRIAAHGVQTRSVKRP